MKLSELITYCQQNLDVCGDYEITQKISGIGDQHKRMVISLELTKGHWLKTRSVTEDEEITIKRRSTIYSIRIEEDIERRESC